MNYVAMSILVPVLWLTSAEVSLIKYPEIKFWIMLLLLLSWVCVNSNLTTIFNCNGVVYATLTSPNQALMELQLQLSQKWNLQSVSKGSPDEHSLGHLPSRPLPPSKGK